MYFVFLLAGVLLGGAPVQQASAAAPAACAAGVDLLGFTDALDDTTYQELNVGGLSALAYDDEQGVYRALLDNDDATPARLYILSILLDDNGMGTPAIEGVTTLSDESGAPFTGDTLDAEGLALLPGGDLLVASETEPSIRRFTGDGRYVESLPVPERYLLENGDAQANATFESLALSPDGTTLYTAVEEPLLSDGQAESGAGRNRILRYELRDGAYLPAADYYYAPDPGNGISDLIALSATDLLVLERGVTLLDGFTVRVYRVSLADAPAVTDLASLAEAEVAPLPKQLLFDLADCPADNSSTFGFGNPLLDNFEGMALGPPLGDRQTLLLLSDDNFESFLITRLIALAVDPPALRGEDTLPSPTVPVDLVSVVRSMAGRYW